jgi:DNA-binding NtrC family response regulator
MNLLIVDDEVALRFAISELFESNNYTVSSAGSGEEALEILEQQHIEIAVIDFHMPGINGMELLSIIKEKYSWIEVIIITAFGSEETAVEAIRKGAYDYIAKPFNNMTLLNRVNHIRESKEASDKSGETPFGHYFAPAMVEIVDKIKTIARTDIALLVTGESGTGKELIARACHHFSERNGRFVSVNCSALPASLIESELFGAEKGSFTGANKQKIGLFELADNGTIFLDEIGEMPFEMQAKLLRTLQESEIVRIGSGIPIKINARIVAATNRNLVEEVQEGRFREDLFYRLNVMHIDIPPLRNRREEIIPLARIFLEQFNRKYDRTITGFSEGALKAMESSPWQGNIRQLRNSIEQAVVLCSTEWIEEPGLTLDGGIPQQQVEKQQSQEETATGSPFNPAKLPTSMVEAKKIVTELFERDFILYYLDQNGWNVKQTAEQIGLYRQDLYKKMKTLGIQKEIKYQ